MAVEVFKGSEVLVGYNSYDDEAWELANFFSQSAHFDIIDSYTDHWWSNRPWDGQEYDPGPPILYRPAATYIGHRYKGDPIADTEARPGGDGGTYNVWHNIDDVGHNCWIVVECQTENPELAAMGYSALPKWQMKIQFANRYNDFADVSDPTGVLYPKCHGVDGIQCMRFAPWGGWNLADVTPDFVPGSPPAGGQASSDNHYMVVSGNQFLVCADGYCARLSLSGDFKTVPLVAGDVVPRSTAHMPNPRAAYTSGSSTFPIASGQGFPRDDFTLTYGPYDYNTSYSGHGGWSFWDHNGNRVQSSYRTQMRSALKYAQPDPWNANFENETHPIIVMPDDAPGHCFRLSHMRKGWGSALQLKGNKQWLSPDFGWTPFFPWDGSTPIY